MLKRADIPSQGRDEACGESQAAPALGTSNLSPVWQHRCYLNRQMGIRSLNRRQ
jgi:hypothetical protein